MLKVFIDLWKRIPPRMQTWMKGAEVAIVTGLVSGLATYPEADFRSRAGIAKYAVSVIGVAGGCLRLYMAQSPVQKIIVEELTKAEVKTPGGSAEQTTKVTVSQRGTRCAD